MDTLKYSPDLFVAREKEIDFVLKAVEEWINDGYLVRRAILFTGPKGSGKSWLLCEIGRQLREKFANFPVVVRHLILGEDRPCDEPFYLPSAQIRKETNSWNDFTSRILRHLAEPPGLPGLPAPIDERSGFLVKQYRDSGRHLVLLVDGVDELPLDFAVDRLEKYVLQPLLEEAGALVVLGGRLPKSRESWTYIYLRAAEEQTLPPFSPSQAEEQLEKLKLPVEKIVQGGGGYPLINRILAESLAAGKSWEQALQETAGKILQGFAEEVQQDFWSLCILAGFHEEEMSFMLGKIFAICRLQLKEMIATRLVRWESQERDIEMAPGEILKVQNEYVMDEAIRRLLEECLHENTPERWKELHRRACELYQEWAGKWPDDLRWSQRRGYHERRLLQAP